MKKKGISLILLVITIIVIIIIAGAITLNLANNNPISQAEEAKFKTDVKTYESELSLALTKKYLENYTFDPATISTSDVGEIREYISSMTEEEAADFKIESGRLVYKGTDENESNWSEESNIQTEYGFDDVVPSVTFVTDGITNDGPVGTTISVEDLGSGLNNTSLKYYWDTQNLVEPESGWSNFTNDEMLIKTNIGEYYLWIKASDNAGNTVVDTSNLFKVNEEVVSEVSGFNKTFSGATSGYNYNNPIIPAGFVAVNTLDTKWDDLNTDYNNGLVVQDENGNQFVWVPVDGTNVEYAKNFTYRSNLIYVWETASETNTTDDTLPTGVTNESLQITNYSGFYIARYEMGNLSDITVSKKGVYPWTYINYADSKSKSEAMYNTSLIKSGLITGTQWDTILGWISNSGKDVLNSSAWGNHKEALSPANVTGYGINQVTGYSEYWKANNIYDFAGNMCEWTTEFSGEYAIYRGGSFGYNGDDNSPVSLRVTDIITLTTSNRTFRTVLYIL